MLQITPSEDKNIGITQVNIMVTDNLATMFDIHHIKYPENPGGYGKTVISLLVYTYKFGNQLNVWTRPIYDMDKASVNETRFFTSYAHLRYLPKIFLGLRESKTNVFSSWERAFGWNNLVYKLQAFVAHLPSCWGADPLEPASVVVIVPYARFTPNSRGT